jgi:5-methyltetrahydropteroyltriglutamate--homocysteine methyltransferase
VPVQALNLGFPRIGLARELKRALEGYWKGSVSAEGLQQTASELRARHWELQRNAGIDAIPCNDFSFYDQMLDMSCLLGCVPARFNWTGQTVDLDTIFAMARGSATAPALEMTKWFDTNYHYLVPEFEREQRLRISSNKVFEECAQARAAGLEPAPVLIGPITFALLGKAKYSPYSLPQMIAALLPVYVEILQKLAPLAKSVQIDEPCLVADLNVEAAARFLPVYERLANAAPQLRIRLATYFGGLGDNLGLAFNLPVEAIHLDLVRAPDQLDAALGHAARTGKTVVLGLVDGRNVWRNDLSASLGVLEKAVDRLGADKVAVAPSCSLLHTPIDLDAEVRMDAQIRGWMSFAKQKLAELAILKRGINQGRAAIRDDLQASDAAAASRKTSRRIHNPGVKHRAMAVTTAMLSRKSPFGNRQKLQAAQFKLPKFPTTTIGSFPQTPEIRAARAAYKAGTLGTTPYTRAMLDEIEKAVRFQERVGLDVLVHGEAERNDMVEYFGEQLEGFVFSEHAWVQSYGSRCVKPPILFGDVSRPKPMTVDWSQYAQSLTTRIVKGMLTGPVTILQWSFVRDDQPRSDTCKQIALAIRDEVVDLEKAGIRMIQIDEPALREGLPVRRSQWRAYLRWAVDCFRLAAAGVPDTTQIHTHMCYSEFNDIIESVGEMDADVISIETSRSQMELLDAFADYSYPNDIGPGVYDIHSPRVPSEEDMRNLLHKAAKVIPPQQLWVNPDCGLKTRGWPEVEAALVNMVAAAQNARRELFTEDAEVDHRSSDVSDVRSLQLMRDARG